MSESDSSLSDAPPPPSIPPDARIARALRDVVHHAFRNDDQDTLTLKSVRAAVTKQLDLPDGFLKSDPTWGGKSKAIVTEQVNKCEERASQAASSPVKQQPKTLAKPTSPVQKSLAKSKSAPKPQKRKTPDSAQARSGAKRRKRAVSDSDGEDDDGSNSGPDDQAAAAKTEQTSPSSAQPTPQRKGAAPKAGTKTTDELGPDSELSDVLDDEPPAKAKRKKRASSPKPKTSSNANGKSSKAPKAKAKAKPDKTMTPHDEEIKRLQGQLAKCGIRKLWGKELAKFDSPRDKIAHLKDMLRDAGMDGRFSEDKARQIRESRELRADLEAIQEGDEMWGTKEDVPRKRLAKGLLELQGLGDDEESD